MSDVSASGLENVVAAVTRLSDVDGAEGRLTLAGLPVEELAGRVSFEHMLFRLWFGRAPDHEELGRLVRQLGAARESAFERVVDLGDALTLPHPMDALRAAVAHAPVVETERSSTTERFAAAVQLVGAVGVFAASWSQASPRKPDPSRGHADDLLHLIHGRQPSPAEVAALDAYLVTVCDHGMNASTFVARVVASTRSDLVSCIVAAIGALKGPLHGGAPGPVLDMLDAIAADERGARAWLEAALARGERIMGMGHRVYRVRDPRAFVLERALAELQRSEGRDAEHRLALARSVEHEAQTLLAERHPDRPLRANVEFYTAVLLEALSVPRSMFSSIFAVGRVAGWSAHVEEQRRVGRLIRPQSHYVAAAPLL